ncbi:Tda5 protein [Martiniozyma asiatica (nom. inval.)]|nr:Tda5 protein [Martiniozyma asiatica]
MIQWAVFKGFLLPEVPITKFYFNIDWIVFLLLSSICNVIFIWTITIIFDINSAAWHVYCNSLTTLWIFSGIDKIIKTASKNPITKKKNIVITGGSLGLGLEITKLYLLKPDVNKVIILDIQKPKIKHEKLIFINHDFSNDDYDNFKWAKDVDVLICNAGVRQKLNATTVDKNNVIKINWTSQIKLIELVLENNKKYLSIMGVGSTLAYLAPKGLGSYSGSKAGLLSMFEALRLEVDSSIAISTIIPGQLDTTMFADKNPSSFLAPIISRHKLAKKIEEIIERRWKGEFVYPVYGRFLPIVKVLPYSVQQVLRYLSGIDEC